MPLVKQDRTLIKELTIEKFRGLSNIHISFGEKITVICGKTAHPNLQYLEFWHKYVVLIKTIQSIQI